MPKAGNTAAEYEDAFGVSKTSPDSTLRSVVAIADGASESLLSRQWAKLLVKRFVRHWQEPSELDEWLSDTLRAWQHEKRSYLRQRVREHKPIQWYEEPGLEAGAFAALLGLVIMRSDPSNESSNGCGFAWRAVAVGDCCLFQMRGEVCFLSFPVTESRAFTNRPFLLSSNPARNAGIAERFQFAEGGAQLHDRFFLMSDALAAWFLYEIEQGAAPWRELSNLFRAKNPAQAVGEWVEARRTAHELRNDDVTLIELEILD